MISLEQEIEKRRKIVEEKEHKVAEANRAVIDAEYDVNMVAKQLAELVAKRDTLTAHLTEAKKNLEEAKAIDVSKIEAELEILNGILLEQQQEEVISQPEASEQEAAEVAEAIPEIVEEEVVTPEEAEVPTTEYVPQEAEFVETPVVEEHKVEKHVNGDPFGSSIDRLNF